MKFISSILGGMMMFMGQSRADYATLEEYKTECRERAHKHGHFYDDVCAEACFYTPSCRLDPQSQGSYCKRNQHPAVCFGLYYDKRGHFRGEHSMHEEKVLDGGMSLKHGHFHRHRFCYEPNDPHCPEQFPLHCGYHHEHKEYEGGHKKVGGYMMDEGM